MSRRIKKVNEFLKQEVSSIINREIETESIITIKSVDTSPDMKKAVIWVSVLKGDEEKTLELIEEKKEILQQSVNKKMKARNVPRINFEIDHSGEYAQRIERILKNEKNKKDS